MVCHHDFHLILIIGLETTLVLRLRRSLEGNFHFLSGVLIGHLGTYFHLATCDSTVLQTDGKDRMQEMEATLLGFLMLEGMRVDGMRL